VCRIPAKTCREEVLDTVRKIVQEKGENEFTVNEVIAYQTEKGTSYQDSTIRTHIQS
jgi:predicted transcriptional regulator